jgi:hypothetical protein
MYFDPDSAQPCGRASPSFIEPKLAMVKSAGFSIPSLLRGPSRLRFRTRYRFVRKFATVRDRGLPEPWRTIDAFYSRTHRISPLQRSVAGQRYQNI